MDAEIWTKNVKNAPKNGLFPPFVTPKVFFSKIRLSLLYPYGALTSCKKLEKTNELSLRYLKADGRTNGPMGGQGQLLWTHSGKPGVQNGF